MDLGNTFQKEKFNIIFRTKFVFPTAEIYGGEKGFYDYFPNGDRIKKNIINEWDKFFARKERMSTITCPIITPEKVLIASGHVARFNDFMVQDLVTEKSYRADHLVCDHLKTLLEDKLLNEDKRKELEDLLQKIDNFGVKELTDIISQFNMKSEDNNEVSLPKPFNLMFEVNIGPSGKVKGYLRPETAQGIFVNFKGLLDVHEGKLPFAVAQIGTSCRNEISPRSGLLRVREFEMAEIEHFLDPLDKSHYRFNTVSNLDLPLFTAFNQENGGSVEMINLGEAVAKKIINNETLGYFIGRIYLFLQKIGIKKVRFRQHMSNEMAHYASDCWDAECLTSYGWIECVGCADRSAYDLSKHTEHSGVKLAATRTLTTPKLVKSVYCKPIMSKLGKLFQKNASIISKYIDSLSEDEAKKLSQKVDGDNKITLTIQDISFEITADCFELKETEKMVEFEEFVPNVIEPSFGIGRIFYCMMEQNFGVRENDENRTFFTIPPSIASYQFAILPLSSRKDLLPTMELIADMLNDADILYCTYTSSASIGKRYVRADTIGIPYAITIDFDSVNKQPASVTMRERDSMKQIRINVDDLAVVAPALAKGLMSWDQMVAKFPAFESQNE